MHYIAYFSMEIAFDPEAPTYAGGLGMLAGDILRGAADLSVPMVGVTLLYRHGYFFQKFDDRGVQIEEIAHWPFHELLSPLENTISVTIEGREVTLRLWRYNIVGATGGVVPVILLDSDVEQNSPYDRTLTNSLYGGDQHYRLAQEVLLGQGGVKALDAAGYEQVSRYHMNEGHAALIVLELSKRLGARGGEGHEARARELKRRCVFTTHTPVAAGHDQFPSDLALRILGPEQHAIVKPFFEHDSLNMTRLALANSGYCHGVAMKHGEVSRKMFPDSEIHAITNGVHSSTWAAPPFRKLFDTYCPNWTRDGMSLRYALGIPLEDIWRAHEAAKSTLIDYINHSTNAGFERHVFTIGFARRSTGYKRPLLIFRNIERLRTIARDVGPIQILFGGKAHPNDWEGKELIRRVHEVWNDDRLKVAFVPNYDFESAKYIVSGVDLWLNNPLPPLEASGTSGMKAALNGIPSLSVLDGWWIEGWIEGVTGWSLGGWELPEHPAELDDSHADELYRKLAGTIMPIYYRDLRTFQSIMRNSIAFNGSFFNTHRLVIQYALGAYGGMKVSVQD